MVYNASDPSVALVEYGDRLVGVGAGTVVVGLLDEIVNYTSVNTTGVDIKPGRITVTNEDLTHLYTYSGAWSLSETHTVRLVKGYSEQHTFDFSYTNHLNETFSYYNMTNESSPAVEFTSNVPNILSISGDDVVTLYDNWYTQIRMWALIPCLNQSWDATPWANLLPAPGDIDSGSRRATTPTRVTSPVA